MYNRNMVRLMCPKNCAGRDGHVHRVRTAEEVRMPADIWSRYQNDSAYWCSYCDAVWFQGREHIAVVVGLYRGGDFEKFPEHQTVYMGKKKKR